MLKLLENINKKYLIITYETGVLAGGANTRPEVKRCILATVMLETIQLCAFPIENGWVVINQNHDHVTVERVGPCSRT